MKKNRMIPLIMLSITMIAGLHCHAASRALPTSVTWKDYEVDGINSKNTATLSWNSKKLLKKSTTTTRYFRDGKWSVAEKKVTKPKYTYYKNGKIKTIKINDRWSDQGVIYYNKKGYITKRTDILNYAKFTYKKGKLVKTKHYQQDSTGVFHSDTGKISRTRYQSNAIKTMTIKGLDSWHTPTVYFDKQGYVVKIVNKAKAKDERTDIFKIKYTKKNNQIKKIKMYYNGSLYRVCTFKYGKTKTSVTKYKTWINIMASLVYDESPMRYIQIFNLDNLYTHVY